MPGYWEELERPAPDSVAVSGGQLRAGSKVRLHPRAGGDVFDLVLEGRTAVVEAVEQNLDDEIVLAVVVEDDPGRELGFARQPGHRFFFSPAEVEFLPDELPGRCAQQGRRILVAGIGNVFLGDDGFGVALSDRLARRQLPEGVEVVDFGIRGMDLAFAMQDGYDAVVLLDAAPRGQPPGTLYVIEADPDSSPEMTVDAHGMDPVQVMALVRTLGGAPPPTYVVGCEPKTRMRLDDEDLDVSLSESVRAALEPAVKLTESLLEDIIQKTTDQEV